MDREQIDTQAWAEYQALVGKEILAKRLDAFFNNNTTDTIEFEQPVRCRVVETRREDVCRWVEDYICDPVYDVEPLEDRPEFRDVAGGQDGWFWVYAASFYKGERRPEESDFEVIA